MLPGGEDHVRPGAGPGAVHVVDGPGRDAELLLLLQDKVLLRLCLALEVLHVSPADGEGPSVTTVEVEAVLLDGLL